LTRLTRIRSVGGLIVLIVIGRCSGAAEPPLGLGEYSVGHRLFEIVDSNRKNRPLPIDAWYPVATDQAVGPLASYEFIPGIRFGFPSKIAHESATISSAQPFPLVIYSPGSFLPGNAYSDFGETLASHGFVVAAITHTGDTPREYSPDESTENQSARDRPRDTSFTIDAMSRKNESPGEPFFGAIDDQANGAAGHSFGAVVSFAAQSGYEPYGVPPDPRIRALMPISPGSGTDINVTGQRATVPTLLIDVDVQRFDAEQTSPPRDHEGQHTHVIHECVRASEVRGGE
jgi:predicted dienelactone hydrolase